MQLKPTIYSGPRALNPIFKSEEEIWLLAFEEMLFWPFTDCDFDLDHEVYIPDGYGFSLSSLVSGLYVDIKYEANLISNIHYRMYEWGPEIIYVPEGEPIIKLTVEKTSFSE